MVAVSQRGWGGPALGVHGKVPIESYVPQGLGRPCPGDHRAGDHLRRADHGELFAAFIISDNIVVKMPGLGLAVSVLIDATVVRLLMVPAVMTLLGRHAWWTPRWLDRILPHVDTEGAGEALGTGGATAGRAPRP